MLVMAAGAAFVGLFVLFAVVPSLLRRGRELREDE